MTDLVLVDTNVILDVTDGDPLWLEWSAERMISLTRKLVINPIIYTELCHQAGQIDEVEAMIPSLGLLYHELPKESLFLASQAYRTYRSRGGLKTAPLADFFIGAHAQAGGFQLLTRDVNRYRTYFPGVPLIHP
ncbi:type II toxin-antitoxin system VapC family toxin [Luteolibacter sp. Populi]|uniref:type II toxin-antitoxin system VapC family toxin n=1 Tax=Luteolibacter sp. Populi TaxID=3230487 RepID=UPI003465529F